MPNKPGDTITLTTEAQERSVESIKRFFAEHMDDELGDLKAKLVLDFFLEEIAPSVYNGAVSDAQAILQARVIDLDGVCYQDEFGYWR
ncbi:MAG: DUF2164 domain-containing protein [Acidobacteria bacterium]|nr:DUF2164 domain-containing protein [Acidobacteriota bacterium]